MKANQCGTWTEQVMYKQGYLTSNQKQAAGIFGKGCEGCTSISYATASPKPRCKLGNFQVTSNATCDKFNQRRNKMKQNLLLAALLAATFNSYASERGNPSQGGQASSNAAAGSLAVAGAAALSSSGALASSGGGSASVGDLTVNGDNYDAKRIPVASAIAPSLTQNVICPIITPNSHAVQFLVFGGSTTGTQSLNAICVAYQLGQHEVVERMACNADAAYRKANPNCGE